jgi:uncharacterized protein
MRVFRDLRSSIHSLGRSFSPPAVQYGPFALALAIGSCGALLFQWLHLPLPWMLGSLSICTLAALLRVPVAAPAIVRPPMTAVIGVMLGAGFTPEVLASIGHWLPTVLGVIVYVVVAGAASTVYFRKVAGFDGPTAYFSGMPGGLVDMVLQGEGRGGDPRTIALVHSSRILLVVLALPFLVQMISGVDLGARPNIGTSLLHTPWMDLALFALTAVIGAFVGRVLRMHAGWLIGPMLTSAAIHVTGVSSFVPPFEVVNFAQLIIGVTIGARFVGANHGEIIRVVGLTLGSVVIMLGLTGAVALLVSSMADYSVTALVLAYAPGGVAEMSLVALALGIEVPFVAAHHIIRAFVVMGGAAAVFRTLRLR